MRRIFVLLVLAAACVASAATAPLVAQQGQSPPAASQQRTTAGTVAPAPPSQGGFYAWVAARQGEYNKRLADTIREIKTGDPWVAALLLAGLSFAYGVLHAAGPGHGKAIISSYVLANERTVRRGIALSFLAALFQALSALILVFVLVFAFQATGLTRKATEAWLETISWALIAALGAWLLWGQLRRLMAQRAVSPAHGHAHAHEHGHAHAHAHAHAGHGHAHAHHSHDHAHAHHSHAHGHTHDHAECCDHAHMPDPRQLEGNWSWSKALALALAVGIRPCTGAIFVLGFAISQGLLWAGVFATFAMALGTAITVSALAAIAVSSRELAARIGGGEGSVWGARVRTVAGVGGSFAVMVLGIVLCLGSLGATAL